MTTAKEFEVERLTTALRDALEGLVEMHGYVPEYYRKKWDHYSYIERATAAIAGMSPQRQEEDPTRDRETISGEEVQP